MKKIALVGAGHANLEVLKSLDANKSPHWRFFLFSIEDTVLYSGLIPRWVLGQIPQQKLLIDLERLCLSKGVAHVQSRVVRIDADHRTLVTSDGHSYGFDLLYLNVGGVPASIAVDPQSADRCIPVKPLRPFIEKWHEIERTLHFYQDLTIAVVGGGAASIEIATAMSLRLRSLHGSRSRVHLFTAADRVGKNYDLKISQSLMKSIQIAGVEVHLSHEVTQVEAQRLFFKDKTLSFGFDFAFHALPVTAPPALELRGIATDSNGFVLVDEFLRASPHVFAAGDCTAFVSERGLPRSGVTAVQQGGLLTANLHRSVSDEALRPYVPPRSQLNILLSGQGSAHAIFGSYFVSGKTAWLLKNYIDNRYLKSFNLDAPNE